MKIFNSNDYANNRACRLQLSFKLPSSLLIVARNLLNSDIVFASIYVL